MAVRRAACCTAASLLFAAVAASADASTRGDYTLEPPNGWEKVDVTKYKSDLKTDFAFGFASDHSGFMSFGLVRRSGDNLGQEIDDRVKGSDVARVLDREPM